MSDSSWVAMLESAFYIRVVEDVMCFDAVKCFSCPNPAFAMIFFIEVFLIESPPPIESLGHCCHWYAALLPYCLYVIHSHFSAPLSPWVYVRCG